MNTKSKSVTLLLATLVIGVVIGALASGTLRKKRVDDFERMPYGERFFRFMDEVIQPTDAQREQFRKIMERREVQIEKLHKQHREQLLAIYDSTKAELSTILTDEQSKRIEKRLQRGADRLIDMRIAHLSSSLNLDENQQKKLREILSSIGEFKPPGQPGIFPENREQMREEFSNKIKEIDEKIETILTPEQREKYHELREEFGPPFPRRPFGRGEFRKGKRPGPPDRPPMDRPF